MMIQWMPFWSQYTITLTFWRTVMARSPPPGSFMFCNLTTCFIFPPEDNHFDLGLLCIFIIVYEICKGLRHEQPFVLIIDSNTNVIRFRDINDLIWWNLISLDKYQTYLQKMKIIIVHIDMIWRFYCIFSYFGLWWMEKKLEA